MRAVLSAGLFGRADPLDLVALFTFAWSGKHRVLPEDLDEALAWIGRRDEEMAASLRLALDESLRLDATLPVGAEVLVLDRRGSFWGPGTPQITVSDAIRVLTEPLRIWVENAESDRAFLWFVVGQELRRELEERRRLGWLEVMMGGGSTLKPQILALSHASEAPRRLRSWAMFDSDRLSSTDTDPDADRLERLCARSLGPRYWRLRRRNIENYLPHVALRAWSKEGPVEHRQAREARVAALRTLGTEAAWHYDMKTGLSGDERHDRRQAREAWLSQLAAEVRAALNTGFGTDISERFAHAEVLRAGPDAEAAAEARTHVDVLRGLL